MTIITKKTDHLLAVKSKYTYRIYPNGNGGMTMEVQLTKDFNNANMNNFALVTMTKNYFEKLSVDRVNQFFLDLRRNIRYDGRYGELNWSYGYIQWRDLMH